MNLIKFQISILCILFSAIVFAQNSGTFKDDRDGHEYKWVKIGDQIWMAENLMWLPTVSPFNETSETEPNYYVYDFDGFNTVDAIKTNNYKKYGVLYNWSAAITACPCGWHLPADEDWNQLELELGLTEAEVEEWGWRGTNQGLKLKSTSDWKENGNGTDIFGFSILPAGKCNSLGFGNLHESSVFWCSNDYNIHYAQNRVFVYDNDGIHKAGSGKHLGQSIRCIKDENPNFGCFTDERDGKVYKTVKIGDQTWMAENLAYGAPSGYPGCDDYGYLYSGGSQNFENIAPDGWHVPTLEEWEELFEYVGGIEAANTALKSNTLWNGTNSVGFNVVPASSVSKPVGPWTMEYSCENTGYTDFWTQTTASWSEYQYEFIKFTDTETFVETNMIIGADNFRRIRLIKDEQTAFNITGKVLDNNGNPVDEASIVIIDKQDKTIIETIKSDNQGDFSIDIENSGSSISLSISKYDPTNNKRFITKNIDITSGEDFSEDIHLTQVEGTIISGWLPKDQDKLDDENELLSFIDEHKDLFNELSPCLIDLSLTNGEFNVGFEGTNWTDPNKWDNSIVGILHNENIQVIPTLGYMYDQNPSPNLLDNLFQSEDKTLINRLIETIRDFVVINGLDGFDIDFESFAYTEKVNNENEIIEDKTLLNKNGYAEFMESLQSELESYNKILYSTIQPPNVQQQILLGIKIDKLSTDNIAYCFDYNRLLNSLHNIRIMCYGTMSTYDDYPHSQCPIELPGFLTDKNVLNNKGFEWQVSLDNIYRMLKNTIDGNNISNITFALPTYGINYLYEDSKYKPNPDIKEPFYSTIETYMEDVTNNRHLRILEFGNDPVERSKSKDQTHNWNIWYQDKESIEARLGYLNNLNQKPAGICFWALHDLPPDLKNAIYKYKNNDVDYERGFSAELNIYNASDATSDLKSTISEEDLINLKVVSPSGRIITREYWDNFQATGDLASCDSAFFEILIYGDTTVIKVNDYYPEEGEYKFFIDTDSDSVNVENMSLNIINDEDTTLVFEKNNITLTVPDTIGVIKNQDFIVTKLNENINICAGEDYNGWSETGKYTRTILSSTGADSVIITTNLTVNELPNPDFTYNLDTLNSVDIYSSYQWYNQDGEIEGATSSQYIIEHSGTFYLEVTNENGCSAKSNGMDLIKTGINDISNGQFNFIVIPNPNDGKFRLRFDNGNTGKCQVQIINENGQVILNKEVKIFKNIHEEEFNLSHLPKGNYFVKVFDGDKTNTEKIILK